MPRYETPEQRAAWAKYMRDYRARTKGEPADQVPLQPTEHQLEILRMYADPQRGGTERAVAEALGISVSAVHNQLGRLKARLGVKDNAQAVMKLWVTNATTQEVPDPLRQPAEDVRGERSEVPTRKADRAKPRRREGRAHTG